jgi:hypothetical protein
VLLSSRILRNPCINPSTSNLDDVATPQDFLRKIGRSLETKVSIDDWNKFWQTTSMDLKQQGLAVRDKRYVPALCLDQTPSDNFPVTHYGA